jgi:hypothetical protein
MAECADEMVILTDGQAMAKIVVPSSALPVVSFAAEELQYHLKKSSGAKLPIITEDQLQDVKCPLIFLGNCGATVRTRILQSWQKPNSYVIKRVDERLYLGGDDSDGPVLTSSGHFGLHSNKVRVGTLFAVYEFLDRHIGVRWLWPGELGEVIPRHTTVTVGKWDQLYVPQLLHSRIRDYNCGAWRNWYSPQAAETYYQNWSKWQRRHRMAQGVDLDLGHMFSESHYWERFGQTHPEFFALRPDGQRAPGGHPHLIQMCVAEPKLWDQIIRDWQKAGSPNILNVTENDHDKDSFICTCEKCRVWGDERVQGGWSERMSRFWLKIQELAEKINPNVRVAALFYGFGPPKKTRLNDRILIGNVPGGYFPWTDEMVGRFKRQWTEGSESGVSQYLRPNWFCFGHNFPVNFAERFIDVYKYMYARNMLATDFDARMEGWASQGLNYYALGRVHSRPELTASDIISEYYDGFGKARDAVRLYCEHWKKVSDISDATYDRMWKKYFPKLIPDNPEHRLHLWFDDLYTPEVMVKARRLLDKARCLSAKDDPIVQSRIEFLAKGLHDVELTMDVARKYRQYDQGKVDVTEYADALRKLRDDRRSLENLGVFDTGLLTSKETVGWKKNWDWSVLDLKP